MKIQERDKEILLGLEKWGVMGLGQVSGLFFKREAMRQERERLFLEKIERRDYWTAAYKRLGMLEKAGLIRKVYYRTAFGRRQVWFLSAAGHGYLKRQKLARLGSYKRTLGITKLHRHRWVVGIGLALSALGWKVKSARELDETGWFTRQKNARDRPQLPDLWIDTGTRSAAVYASLIPWRNWEPLEAGWRMFQARFPGVRILHVRAAAYQLEPLVRHARSLGFPLVGVGSGIEFERDLERYRFASSGPEEFFRLDAGTAARKELAEVYA